MKNEKVKIAGKGLLGLGLIGLGFIAEWYGKDSLEECCKKVKELLTAKNTQI